MIQGDTHSRPSLCIKLGRVRVAGAGFRANDVPDTESPAPGALIVRRIAAKIRHPGKRPEPHQIPPDVRFPLKSMLSI